MSNVTRKQQKIIENFNEVDQEKPSDQIIGQIKQLISVGTLKPGYRLPSERAFAEKLGVGRGHIREALKKLEYYGILKTFPQSGTVVVSLGEKPPEDSAADVLESVKNDLGSLLETRCILEASAAGLTATRATKSEIVELIKIHEKFRKLVRNQESGVAEDDLFHLKIAEFSENTVLCSLITLITAEITLHSTKQGTRGDHRASAVLNEHEAILQGIKQKNSDKTAAAMEIHMEMAARQFNL